MPKHIGHSKISVSGWIERFPNARLLELFVINVESDDGTNWSCERSFTEFEKLEKGLSPKSKVPLPSSSLPVSSKKKANEATFTAAMEDRRKGLEEYLRGKSYYKQKQKNKKNKKKQKNKKTKNKKTKNKKTKKQKNKKTNKKKRKNENENEKQLAQKKSSTI